jgi:hypothetical protein
VTETAVEGGTGAGRGLLKWATQHELGIYFALLMELSWVVPVFRATASPLRAWSTFGATAMLIAIALLALYGNRWMVSAGLPAILRDVLQAVALLGLLAIAMQAIILSNLNTSLGVLLADPIRLVNLVIDRLVLVIVVLMSVVYAWWRGGAAAGASPLSPQGVGFRFRLIVLLLAVEGIFQRGAGVRPLLEILPLTFGAALLAMSISRAQSIARGPGARQNPFGRGWALGLASLVLLTIAAGALVGKLLGTPGAFDAARTFGKGLFALLQLLLAPVLFVLFLTIYQALRSFNPGDETQIPRPLDLNEVQDWMSELQRRTGADASWIAWINAHGETLILLLLGAILLAVVIGVVLFARREGERSGVEDADEGESLFSRQALIDDLRNRLRKAGEALDPRRFAAGLRRRWVESVVRRIYARLLRLAAERGVERRPSETPLEFSSRLQFSYPDAQAAALLITQAYNKVRYGELPDEEIDLQGVRSSWQHLQTEVMRRRPQREEPEKAEPGGAEEGHETG